MFKRILLIGCLLTLLTACAELPLQNEATATAPTPAPLPTVAAPIIEATAFMESSSGIEGIVLIGPACPGPVRTDTPCPDQPFQAVISVLNSGEQVVQEIKTAEDGLFRIELPPGTYTLQPQAPNVVTRAADQSVTVEAGQFISVTIVYDSGMR